MPLSQTFEYKMSFILRGKDKVLKRNQKSGFYKIKYPIEKPFFKKTKIKQHGKHTSKPLNDLEQAK